MLKTLQKYFSPSGDEFVPHKEEEMTKTTVVDEGQSGLQAVVDTLTKELATATTTIAELTAQVAAATEFKAAQEKLVVEAKSAARLAQLVGAVGTDKAASLHAAFASVDDTAFEAVVMALNANAKAEGTTPLFKEAGVDAVAEPAKAASENRVMDYLKQMTPAELNNAK